MSANDKTLEKQVEFTSGGLTLRGMVHLPDAQGSSPAIVVFHGFTGNRIGGEFLPVKLSRALAGAGIASLRFDFAGSGESEGEFVDMSPLTELADARSALEFLARQEGVDPGRLGAYGHSLGGMVAAMLLEDVRLGSGAILAAVADLPGLMDAKPADEDESTMDELGYV
ncbi:MAG: alpha/beta hydrolase, partial [Planctomycetota bacterium]